MLLCVGSTNPVKVNAVKIASQSKWPEVQVEGIDVPSGIAAQPRTDEETRLGAENRARAVLAAGQEKWPTQTQIAGIGLEGGIFTTTSGEMWSTVWGAVVGPEGKVYVANGARFQLPAALAERIGAGEEMSAAVTALTGIADIGKLHGMIGIVTNNFVDRTEEYANIAKLALGLWYGSKEKYF